MSIEWIQLVMKRLRQFEKELDDIAQQLDTLSGRLWKLEEKIKE